MRRTALLLSSVLFSSLIGISSLNTAEGKGQPLTIEYNGRDYEGSYLITGTGGGTLNNITAAFHSIRAIATSEFSAHLILILPRELMNATDIVYVSNGTVSGIQEYVLLQGVLVDGNKTNDYTAGISQSVISIKIPFEVGTHEIELVGVEFDGSVSTTGCAHIGGRVAELEIESGEVITVCEYREKVLKAFGNEGIGCLAQEGFWIDPETGESFTVPSTSCDIPVLKSEAFCRSETSIVRYSNSLIAHTDKIINVEDRRFYFALDTAGVTCYGLSLKQDTKELFIIFVSNDLQKPRSMNITFPSEFLKGNYTVIADGNRTDFTLSMTDNIVSLSQIELPETAHNRGIVINRVQIIGTEVIPEFNYPLLYLVCVFAFAGLISLRYSWTFAHN